MVGHTEKGRIAFILSSAICGILGTLLLPASSFGEKASKAELALGKKVYDVNCAGCHGDQGRGDGPAAPYLFPKPRDYSRGRFKLTSTPSGSLPTDQDLFDTITHGMPGSAMPSWEQLAEKERWAIVKYIKTLVRIWDEDEEEWINLYDQWGESKPIAIPPETPNTVESVARGKILYRKAECSKCHGDTGRGDGPSAPTLKDDWGNPILPRDYTAGIFKGGRRPVDIYKRITIGIGGTPMPAHDKLTAAQRWDIVHYVLSLVRSGAQDLAIQRRRTITVQRVSKLPAQPDDAAWEKIQTTYVALMPLWWRRDRILGILVRAAHDGKTMAIQLSWEDVTHNISLARVEKFADGGAIQFALSDDVPFIAMGGTGGKVNVWFWRADRTEPSDIENEYPRTAVDMYERTTSGTKKGTGKTEYFTGNVPTAKHSSLFLSGWRAGNLVADPNRKTTVDNMNAKGFGTLSVQSRAHQTVQAKAKWDKGVWRVVYQRAMTDGNPNNAQFTPGKHFPVAFAIWDGEYRDRNGQKSVTIWHDLKIE